MTAVTNLQRPDQRPFINKQGCKCKSGGLLLYLCAMQTEITSQDLFPEVKEENIKAVTRRSEEYSLLRDKRAREDNEAIARRLEKEKEKPEEKI